MTRATSSTRTVVEHRFEVPCEEPHGGDVKDLYTRSLPFGRRVYVPGDPKGEHTAVAEAVGGRAIVLGHGLSNRLNPLDEGLITAPNVVLSGIVGSGKSSLAKSSLGVAMTWARKKAEELDLDTGADDWAKLYVEDESLVIVVREVKD